jgi:hypothetical protein
MPVQPPIKIDTVCQILDTMSFVLGGQAAPISWAFAGTRLHVTKVDARRSALDIRASIYFVP